MTTVEEDVGAILGLFLRRADFLGIGLKLMESQGGAKGFGIMGTSHTSLSLCYSTAEVPSAERSIQHQMFICDSEIYSSE